MKKPTLVRYIEVPPHNEKQARQIECHHANMRIVITEPPGLSHKNKRIQIKPNQFRVKTGVRLLTKKSKIKKIIVVFFLSDPGLWQHIVQIALKEATHRTPPH